MCSNRTIPDIGSKTSPTRSKPVQIREELRVISDILDLQGQRLAACYVSMAAEQLEGGELYTPGLDQQ